MQSLYANRTSGRALAEVLLQSKRELLLQGYPMILGLATYGSVDHRLEARVG